MSAPAGRGCCAAPPNGGCPDAATCPHAALCDAQPPGPDARCLRFDSAHRPEPVEGKVVAEERTSDDQRRAESLGYFFPGAEAVCRADLEPTLF